MLFVLNVVYIVTSHEYWFSQGIAITEMLLLLQGTNNRIILQAASYIPNKKCPPIQVHNTSKKYYFLLKEAGQCNSFYIFYQVAISEQFDFNDTQNVFAPQNAC